MFRKPEVKIKDRSIDITVELPLEEPRPSHSGKTITIASTDGFSFTDAQFEHEGKMKTVRIQVNVAVDPSF